MDYEDELDWLRNRKKRNADGRREAAKRSGAGERSRAGKRSGYMERNAAYRESGNGDEYENRSRRMEYDKAVESSRSRRGKSENDGRNMKRSRYLERSSSEDYYNPKKQRGKSGRNGKGGFDDGREADTRNRKNPRLVKKRKKRKLLIIELTLLAVLAVAAFFLFGKTTGQKGYWTIAVFGVDSRHGNLEKGTESDVEMLFNINKATGEIKLVSVYRDTYLKIDGKGTYFKINEAYNKGGHKQALAALQENLDLKIDDYATFNWKAVAQAINILGGVDIDVTAAEFSYINGFITETVNSTGIGSHQLKKAGMNHLDGVQAVSYARLRLMDTDFNRTQRQRKVLGLVLQKAKEANPATLKTLVSTVFPQVSTSVGIGDLFTIASGISKYHVTETAGFPFSHINMKIDRRDCVVPTTLESNVIQLHQFLYGEENYTPSAAVKSISAKLSKISGISEPGKNVPIGDGIKGQKPASESKSKQVTPAPKTETSIEATKETKAKATDEAVTKPEESVPEKETHQDGSLIGPGAGMNGSLDGKKERGSRGETKAVSEEESKNESIDESKKELKEELKEGTTIANPSDSGPTSSKPSNWEPSSSSPSPSPKGENKVPGNDAAGRTPRGQEQPGKSGLTGPGA